MRMGLGRASAALLCLALARGQDAPATTPAPANVACSSDQFRCWDGRECVPAKWVCDGERDCADGSDESAACPPRLCEEAEFHCALSGHCVPLGYRCDGEPDCGVAEGRLDASDEDPVFCNASVACAPNEAACLTRPDLCVHLSLWCEDHRHCPDGSDEGGSCGKAPPPDAHCHYGMAWVGDELRCYCPDGAAYDAAAQKCLDEDECARDTPVCDHRCLNARYPTTPGYRCSCLPGFQLDAASRACHPTAPEKPSIVYVHSSNIRHISLEGKLLGRREIWKTKEVAFDVNARDRVLCWMDRNRAHHFTVMCADVAENGNISRGTEQQKERGINFRVEGAVAMAFDWVTGNWYFADALYQRIFVCSKSFSLCEALVWGLDGPRDVAVDPSVGVGFYLEAGRRRPGLSRVALSGGSPTSLASKGIIQPTGLTLDHGGERVYWADAYLEEVQSVDYWGLRRRRVVAKGSFVKSLFSLDLWDQSLFASDHYHAKLLRLNKTSGGDIRTVGQGADFVRANRLKVLHSSRQPIKEPSARLCQQCDHLCLLEPSRTASGQRGIKEVCHCASGSRLVNGKCQTVDESPFLIAGKTKPGQIRALSIGGNDWEPMARIQNVERPTAMTAYPAQGEVIFADSANFTIQAQKVFPVGSGGSRRLVLDEGLENCEGLAVDWASAQLYWSDAGKGRISVLSLAEPSVRKVLVWTELTNVRALAVAPAAGLLFWSDWVDQADVAQGRRAKIESASLDGTGRKAIVTEDVQWPNGLALDLKGEWLYWCDAFYDSVGRVRFDGSQPSRLLGRERVSHPYGLAFHPPSTLFFSEFRSSKVFSLQVGADGSPGELKLLHTDPTPLFEIHVFDADAQKSTTSCSTDLGGCDQLCFNVPQKSGSSEASRVCDCGEGWKLGKDGRTCAKDEAYRPSSDCDPEREYRCLKTHRCVDLAHLCDGDDDCGDKSDEQDKRCAEKACAPGTVKCGDNTCVPSDWQCDGEADCAGGEDEAKALCKAGGEGRGVCEGGFRCLTSGACLPLGWRCDGEADCGAADDSDERDCPAGPAAVCPAGGFLCSPSSTGSVCLPPALVCDGRKDCPGGEDEASCRAQPCLQGHEFRCPEGGACLPSSFQCDGYADCRQSLADEEGCSASRSGCLENQFSCHVGGCVRKDFHCDGVPDCLDGSDEKGCQSVVCPEGYDRCEDGKECFNRAFRCDGHADCADGTDEKACSVTRVPEGGCAKPRWACANDSTVCLPVGWACDLKSDCADESDEMLCALGSCETSACDQLCHALPSGPVCACRPGWHVSPLDASKCDKEDPCDTFGICDQLCTSRGGHRHFCHCRPGFALQSDKFSCKAEPAEEPAPFLLFSNRHQIRLVGLRDERSTALADGLRNSIALDFLLSRNESLAPSRLFWSDIAEDGIFSAALLGTGLAERRTLVEAGVATTEGIAVDWLEELLYWVDSSLDLIQVIRLDGTQRAVVLSGGMSNLRALALDPNEGLMFWTDWEEGNPRIERATMAGQDRRVIFSVASVHNGGWPNGLTLDFAPKRLYWIDAKSDSVHTSDYAGGDHRVVLRAHDFLSHPFAVSVFEGRVFWTDWRVNSVCSASKWNGSAVAVVASTNSQPFDVKVVSRQRQPLGPGGRDPCGRLKCSHLCLRNSSTTALCACPYMAEMGLHGCQPLSKALLFLEDDRRLLGFQLKAPGYPNAIPALSPSQSDSARVLAFAADSLNGQVFWLQSSGLYKRRLNGSEVSLVQRWDGVGVDGLAVHAPSGGLLVAGPGPSVVLLSQDGRFERPLIRTPVPPRQICMDELFGLVFWVEGKRSLNVSCLSQTKTLNDAIRKALQSLPAEYVSGDIHSAHFDGASRSLCWLCKGDAKLRCLSLTAKNPFGDESSSQTSLSLVALGSDRDVTAAARDGAVVHFFDAKTKELLVHTIDSGSAVGGAVKMRRTQHRVTRLGLYRRGGELRDGSCSACGQLCLGLGECVCSLGFTADPEDGRRCVGLPRFLLSAEQGQLRGFSLPDGGGGPLIPVLAPVTGAKDVVAVDWEVWDAEEWIWWLESRPGPMFNKPDSLQRVRRNLANRTTVIEAPQEWNLAAFAVDSVAGNVYFVSEPRLGPKGRGVLEVARRDGSLRLPIHHFTEGLPTKLLVSPGLGFLVFLMDDGDIKLSRLDGNGDKLAGLQTLVGGKAVTDIALSGPHLLYTSDKGGQTILSTQPLRAEPLQESDITSRPLSSSMSHFAPLPGGGIIGYSQGKDGQLILDGSGPVLEGIWKQGSGGAAVRDLRVFDAQQSLVADANECRLDNGRCEGLCLWRGPALGVTCACVFARLAEDGRRCEPHKAYLAYSLAREVRFVALFGEEASSPPHAPLPATPGALGQVVALAADGPTDRLFYSDMQASHIGLMSLDAGRAGEAAQVLVEGEHSVEGLAFDPTHQDLYWTSFANSSISRLHLGPHVTFPAAPTRLIRLAKEDKPRGIALDFCSMRVYWTNWGHQPSIQRAFFSGRGIQTLISGKDVATPNGLALDLKNGHLFWADARLDKIERADLDGSNRVVLSKTPEHPYAMLVHDGSVYWTDWGHRAVGRVSTEDGGGFGLLAGNVSVAPYSLALVSQEAMDKCPSPCDTLTPPCAGLCATTAEGRAVCRCGPGLELASDGVSCERRPEASCGDDEFDCGGDRGRECVPYLLVCDGVPECPNRADEDEAFCRARDACPPPLQQCADGQCASREEDCPAEEGDDCEFGFRCRSDGHCVASHKICDAVPHCSDASDEARSFCDAAQGEVRSCSEHTSQGKAMMNCGRTTACILAEWKCDGKDDCWDGWDEEGCPPPSLPKHCSSKEHRCSPSECIPLGWRCDGTADCGDESDEAGCPEPCDGAQEWNCGDSECILKAWHCDGHQDCSNGADEADCPQQPDCAESELRCGQRCVPLKWRCDGENDCNDQHPGTDEKDCPVTAVDVPCGPADFRCSLSGRCLPARLYCDGRSDCGDGSDEPSDCPPQPKECRADQFTCAGDGHCVPDAWTCNGLEDCADGSDEAVSYCTALFNHSLSCGAGEQKCGGTEVCVAETRLCDGANDCGDWSDELGCGIDECRIGLAQCEHQCEDLPVGFRCTCPKGFQLAEDGRACEDEDECKSPGLVCSQLCHNSRGGFVCFCAAGYALAPDGVSCKRTDGEEPLLIVSSRYYLHSFSLRGTPRATLLANLTNAVALDFHAQHNDLFFSEVIAHNSYIARFSLNEQRSNGTFHKLSELKTRNPDGIAVDWAGGNIYWCDKAEDSIKVARLEGRYPKTLLKGRPLNEPRAIVVDPAERYLFWSDWGQAPHIGRMEMDGSNSGILINESLLWPNGLALDRPAMRLYWGDAGNGYIAVCDYDGRGVQKIVPSGVRHIFGLAVFEQWLFWTDWETLKVERAHKLTGLNRTVLVKRLEHRPMGIGVLHSAAQAPLARAANPCEGGGWCSNLCLLSRSSERGHVCGCPDHFRPSGRLDCAADCAPFHFVCEKTYKCLPLWWRCDGQDDCGDGQDELFFKPGACPSPVCPPGRYRCLQTHAKGTAGAVANDAPPTCLHPSKLCDGKKDCLMEDDEGAHTHVLDCHTYRCLETSQWKCPNSKLCIPVSQKCDGLKQCPGGEDEDDCRLGECSLAGDHRCGPPSLSTALAGTDGGGCVGATFVCDGHPDCADASDEAPALCESRKCSGGEFRCGSGRCVPESWVCDGDADCADGDDERDCAVPADPCPQDFRCNATTSQCVPLRWRCDGSEDCAGGEDEEGCAAGVRCGPGDFGCKDGSACLAQEFRCDGEADCGDGSDEAACPGPAPGACQPSDFRCPASGACVPKTWRCDGEADCAGGEDEAACASACGPAHFRCGDGECVERLWLCDGSRDCPDGADEAPALCRARGCVPGTEKCGDGTCFPSRLACDGTVQCAEGWDESAARCTPRRAGNGSLTCGFRCGNGHCSEAEAQCDGFDDCGDGSDEEGCAADACGAYGTCPQRCVLRQGGRPKCSCAQGYVAVGRGASHTPASRGALAWLARDRCRVAGAQKPLLLAYAHQTLRLVQLGGQHGPLTIATLHVAPRRVESATVLLQDSKPFLYFSENHPTGSNASSALYKLEFPGELGSRPKRAVGAAQELFKAPAGHRIAGLASDGTQGNLFWAEVWEGGAWIAVGSGDGQVRRVLLDWDLERPESLAVGRSAREGKSFLFWTEAGRSPRIERVHLDGSDRQIIVNSQLQLPSGLAADSPNERLYWADSAQGLIETSDFHGKDRRIVYRSHVIRVPDKVGLPKPLYLDVFEDSVYFSRRQGSEIFALPKINLDRELVPRKLVGGTVGRQRTRPWVWHRLREGGAESPCSEAACPSGALCTVGSANDAAVCLCGGGGALVEADGKAECRPDEAASPQGCPLACRNGGVCESWRGELRCRCPSPFAGGLCQHDVCRGRCLNGGLCSGNGTGVGAGEEVGWAELRCLCPPAFDGPRCERRKCNGFCLHGGSCRLQPSSDEPLCSCRGGRWGERCEEGPTSACAPGHCHHGGLCHPPDAPDGPPQCACEKPFTGPRCEHCVNALGRLHRCLNGGRCGLSLDTCVCPALFGGPHCERDLCPLLCANGATCRLGPAGQTLCDCQPGFRGPHCETDLCELECGRGQPCRVDEEGSVHCASEEPPKVLPLPCRRFCENGADCSVEELTGRPECHCPRGLAGRRCERVAAETCAELACRNGGACVEVEGVEVGRSEVGLALRRSHGPQCRCGPGWAGLVCATPTCNHFCLNAARCFLRAHSAFCHCHGPFHGPRCQFSLGGAASEESSLSWSLAQVLVPLLLAICAVLGLLYLLVVRKRPLTQFSHRRMSEETVEEAGDAAAVLNPAFGHGEEEAAGPAQPMLQHPQPTHFHNPTYEEMAVYNDTVDGPQAQALLPRPKGTT